LEIFSLQNKTEFQTEFSYFKIFFTKWHKVATKKIKSLLNCNKKSTSFSIAFIIHTCKSVICKFLLSLPYCIHGHVLSRVTAMALGFMIVRARLRPSWAWPNFSEVQVFGNIKTCPNLCQGSPWYPAGIMRNKWKELMPTLEGNMGILFFWNSSQTSGGKIMLRVLWLGLHRRQ